MDNSNTEIPLPRTDNVEAGDGDNVQPDVDGKAGEQQQSASDGNAASNEPPKNPEETLDLVSRLFLFWMEGLLWKGFRKPLQQSDLPPVHTSDASNRLYRRFDRAWSAEMKKKKPSLVLVLLKLYLPYFSISTMLYFVFAVCQLLVPELMRMLLETLPNPMEPNWKCYALGFGIFASLTLGSFCMYHGNVISQRTGAHIRSIIFLSVYRKSMKISSFEQKDVGQITNLVVNDTQRIADTFMFLNFGLVAPFQVLVTIILLYRLVSWTSFIGLGIMILSFPFNGVMAGLFMTMRRKQIIFTDKRVRLVTEALQSMRVIKFYSWETAFIKKIKKLRVVEMAWFGGFHFLRSFMVVMVMTVPTLVSVSVFVTYSLIGNQLKPSIVFPALTYFNLLRSPLISMPFLIAISAQLKVAFSRMHKFLVMPEVNEPAITRTADPERPNGITVTNSSFYWTTEAPGLRDINMSVHQGEIAMVIGLVGAGKSTLCSGLIGECHVSGSVNINGRIAYVAQQAFIINASVRDNILWGLPFDQEKYDIAVKACALTKDFELLPDGDQTEIGERGVTISGGQKQRIAMARAVYNDADIYILDDPLSAVDAHVAKHMYWECIDKLLKNKAVLLVTNQLNFLENATRVFVIENNTIAVQGTFNELMESSGHDFIERVLRTHTRKGEGQSTDNLEGLVDIAAIGVEATPMPPQLAPSFPQADNKEPGKVDKPAHQLMSQEERQIGAVHPKIYLYYLWTGFLPLSLFSLSLFIVDAAARGWADYWLAYWPNHSPTPEIFDRNLYLYILWSFLNAATLFWRSMVFSLVNFIASYVLHNKLLKSVFHCPTSFFDTTPTGRIVNRFSKDIDMIDFSLPAATVQALDAFMLIFSSVVVISIMSPVVIAAAIPIGIIFFFLQGYYRHTSRELQRIEAISRSPILAQVTETLNGLATIRAYGSQDRFVERNETLVDNNVRAFVTLFIGNQWLGIRLDLLGFVFFLITTLIMAYNRLTIDPGLSGLSLSYAMALVITLNRACQMLADTETKMNSVERVVEYLKLERDAPAHIRDPTRPKRWVTSGQITFKDVVMRYRADLEPVLKSVSLEIRPNEKLAVVGRTGSGKSSMMLALFRMVPLTSGSIEIDRRDIYKMGLKDLHDELAMIPQDPVLFSGTVRSNLDPFHEYTDEQIWSALECIQLRSVIEQMDGKLDAEVSENGENFSVGQRQLMCLGRALLKNSKILVMDEATASVDVETDALIQKTIRERFQNATVLTVAHRLNTVMDFDRILVMRDGTIAELDTPLALLERQPPTLFAEMVEQTGPANAAHLRELARRKTHEVATTDLS